jgi:hypothetical protein
MAEEPRKPVGVIVVDFKMPFWRLVLLIMKCALAAIPALMILAALWYAISVFTIGRLADHTGSSSARPPAVSSETPPLAHGNEPEPDLGVMSRQIRIDSRRDTAFRECSRLSINGTAAICARQAADCMRAIRNAAASESETDALLGCLDTVGQ